MTKETTTGQFNLMHYPMKQAYSQKEAYAGCLALLRSYTGWDGNDPLYVVYYIHVIL